MDPAFERLDGKGMLIHHWDVDGLTSAALILHHLPDNDLDTMTPTLGNYYLTDDEIEDISDYDYVIICDMALPKENIDTLLQHVTEILIFDHHLQEKNDAITLHHNPILDGKDPALYPSASWVINTFFGSSPNLYALLGVIGDNECSIKDNKILYAHIQEYCIENHLTFEDLLDLTYLLDSAYKTGDKEGVEAIPHLLIQNWQDPQYIKNNPVWNTNLKNLKGHLEKELSNIPEPEGGIIVKTLDAQYNTISTITRKIYWKEHRDTIVINTGYFPDHDQVYVRSETDLGPMIRFGKEHGFNCGGKKQVLGAIVPKNQTQSFLIELKNYLKGDVHTTTI